MQTNQKKKTKTYGLVGLGAPFRQGRSLSLPTQPFQRTNRYAVVGETPLTHTWTVISWLLPQNPYIIGVFWMKHQTFDTKQRCKEKSLCQLPRSGCWSSSYLLPILSCSRYIVGIVSTIYIIGVGGTRNSHFANYRVAVAWVVATFLPN